VTEKKDKKKYSGPMLNKKGFLPCYISHRPKQSLDTICPIPPEELVVSVIDHGPLHRTLLFTWEIFFTTGGSQPIPPEALVVGIVDDGSPAIKAARLGKS
jgi:hypothetical protein